MARTASMPAPRYRRSKRTPGSSKASSSVIGPDEPIRLPFAERRFDHEAEVGVVIGARATSVSREQAMDHVFGYVPLLDITMRGPEDRSFRKSFDTFTPIGPAIVTADEVPVRPTSASN